MTTNEHIWALMSTNAYAFGGVCLHFVQRQELGERPLCLDEVPRGHDGKQPKNVDAPLYRFDICHRHQEEQQHFLEGLLFGFAPPPSRIDGPQYVLEARQHHVDITPIDLVLHQDKMEGLVNPVEGQIEQSDVRQPTAELYRCPVDVRIRDVEAAQRGHDVWRNGEVVSPYLP